MNPGGPGNSGVDFVRGGGGELLDGYVQGRFDIVGWDVRGSAGASTRVRCFTNQRSRTRLWGTPSVPSTDASRYARRQGPGGSARRPAARALAPRADTGAVG
jgi:hypothetical protein